MKNFPFCILIPGFVFSCLAMGCDSGGEFSRFSVDSPNRVAASLVTENFEEGAKVENRATGAASESTVRFATYNVAMNRKEKNELLKELESGNSAQAAKVAEIIQRTRPDVLLLNEFDYDESGKGIQIFCDSYLGKSQNGQEPIKYEHVYFGPVNTGYDSGFDLNNNGKKGEPDDAFGFGQFPGKYAMVVLSRYSIDRDNVRTFQKFLWKDMPDNLWPIVPDSKKPFYNDEIKEVFRLSSKSHWDIPIQIGDKTIHFLTAHPTPPAFDGPEDRNGARNHDEIRMLVDYIGGKANYLYDDKGVKGGLAADSHFVIAGDLNADPVDGDDDGKAGKLLMFHPAIQANPIPSSEGGPTMAKKQGQANEAQKGDPAHDTADFNDRRPGNLRVDYCLPSKTLKMTANGVYWPKPDEPGGDLVNASDHRMVWIDIEK